MVQSTALAFYIDGTAAKDAKAASFPISHLIVLAGAPGWVCRGRGGDTLLAMLVIGSTLLMRCERKAGTRPDMAHYLVMFAIPPKADIQGCPFEVRPKSDAGALLRPQKPTRADQDGDHDNYPDCYS